MDDFLELLNQLAEGLGQAGENFEMLGQRAATELTDAGLPSGTLAQITGSAKQLCDSLTQLVADIDTSENNGVNLETVIARQAYGEALSAALGRLADESKRSIDALPPGAARDILRTFENHVLTRLTGAYRKQLLQEFDEEAKAFDVHRTPLDRDKVREVLDALRDFQRLVCYFSDKIKDLTPASIIECCTAIASCCYGAAKVVADAAAGAGSLAAPGPHTLHVVAAATVSIFSGARRLIKGVNKLKKLLNW
jgi:hypothetical protein